MLQMPPTMADTATIIIKLDEAQTERLAALAAEEGVSLDQMAKALVEDGVSVAFLEPPPGWARVTDEELKASIEAQRRRIASGEEQLIPHEEVMRGAQAIIDAARERRK